MSEYVVDQPAEILELSCFHSDLSHVASVLICGRTT
jgi:hypothetical protein